MMDEKQNPEEAEVTDDELTDDELRDHTEETFTPLELRMAEEAGESPQWIRENLEKDRLMAALPTIEDFVTKVSEAGHKGESVVDMITKKYQLNEREIASFSAMLRGAYELGNAGMGATALLAVFELGKEFAYKDVPDYTEEDHAEFERMVALRKQEAEERARAYNEQAVKQMLMNNPDLPSAG